MAAAAAGDIREYRISNRYLGFALIAGISGALTWGEGSMAERSLFAAGFVIRLITVVILGFPIYRRGMIGAGDVKMAALLDRKSTRLNSSHSGESRMPSSA